MLCAMEVFLEHMHAVRSAFHPIYITGIISRCYVLLYLAYCRWVNIEELYYLSFERLLRLAKLKLATSNAGIRK